MNKQENAIARSFEVTARNLVKGEGMVAGALKALGELIKPFLATDKETGKVSLSRDIRPYRVKWINAYAKARAIDPDSDGARQAWSRYSRAALAGDSSLENTQSRKPVHAAGSKQAPVSAGPLPAAIVEANTLGAARAETAGQEHVVWDGEPGAALEEGKALHVPVTHAQRLALAVNNERASVAELGVMIGKLDSKVKGRQELLAAFNRLADNGRELETAAIKVLTA